MLAAGAEMATTPTGLRRLRPGQGALDPQRSSPQTASRPWDRERDGFVLSVTAAGAMVLEEYEHARRRGARIYAELVGFGMSGDAYHITAPPDDGDGARLAMVNALRDAQLDASDVQYLNAHATSTPLGDKAETIAIKRSSSRRSRRL